jgi:imidazolonepropionase-like amidohydrolase
MISKSILDRPKARCALSFLAIVIFSAAVVTSSPAQERSPQPQKRVIVHAGKLLDVKSGTTLSDQIIVIEGDKITSVGAATLLKVTSDGERIELPNATVLPGLIDCHVHLTVSPHLFGPAGLHTSYPRSALLGARNARITLSAGFTTVRNVAADGYADVALRDAINAGDVPGPRMLVSGPALSITGGHWDQNFLGPQFAFSNNGVADGVSAVTKQVRENIKYGADLIKVMATGGVVSEGDNPALAQYSPEELKAIVETAHGLGRKVAAHAHAAVGIRNAVLAGADSIEHGSYITDQEIQLMKEHGTYLVPTVYLEDWILQNLQNLGWTPNSMEKGRTLIPIANKNVSHAFKSGVKVALGTDAGVYPHGLNGHEFHKMVEMGLTPLQAIQAGTVNAADLLGRSDKVGTIESGKWADIVAVDGDPLQDITTLEHVKFVMKGGTVIKNEYAH